MGNYNKQDFIRFKRAINENVLWAIISCVQILNVVFVLCRYIHVPYTHELVYTHTSIHVYICIICNACVCIYKCTCMFMFLSVIY